MYIGHSIHNPSNLAQIVDMLGLIISLFTTWTTQIRSELEYQCVISMPRSYSCGILIQLRAQSGLNTNHDSITWRNALFWG